MMTIDKPTEKNGFSSTENRSDKLREIEAFEQVLKLKFQQTYSERLSAISHFTTTVAARLNDLLTPIVCYSQLMLQSHESQRFQNSIEKILTAAREAKTIMDGLLDFTSEQPRHTESLNLSRIIRETIPIAAELLELNENDVRFEEEAPLPRFKGDPHQMVQVVLHLLRNAIRATVPAERPVVIRASASSNELRRWNGTLKTGLVLEVTDRGCGIPQRDLCKVLLPFFTTRPDEGIGLGLSIVYGVVQAHGGDMEIESHVGKGTTIRLFLPAE